MLNISDISTSPYISKDQYESFQKAPITKANIWFRRWLIGVFLLSLVVLFLPWTQNIQSKGKLTTLKPEQRPQTIHSTIAGRVERWYVREGELVRKGDTIVYISEIKTEYFDPQLVDRAEQQVNAKEGAVVSYQQKAGALVDQIAATRAELIAKRQQLQNKIIQNKLKIESDSIELARAVIDHETAIQQYNRAKILYDKGLEPLIELEQKNLKVQETNAKRISGENKLLTSRNERDNARLELMNIENEYASKIAKAQSDRFSTLSDMYSAEGSVAKMRSELTNYQQRNSFYYITAPQDCYITKAIVTGVGETVKEGEAIVSIMPADFQLAVEMYVRPLDLNLVHAGQKVNFIFDGWPAFVFAGWPNLTFGTYSGEVVAIDNSTSENNLYRILVSPGPNDRPWPEALRVGSAAQCIALLEDVPVWYEIWRQLNGFPPEYYQEVLKPGEEPKLKAPVKSIPK